MGLAQNADYPESHAVRVATSVRLMGFGLPDERRDQHNKDLRKTSVGSAARIGGDLS